MLLPTHIERARAYDADSNMRYLGMSAITLPSFESNTVTLEGMGLAGSVDKPVRGSYSSTKVSSTFRGLSSDVFNMLNGVKTIDWRASQNVFDTGLNVNKSVQIRVVATGEISTFDLGDGDIPGTMSVKADMECYTLKVWVDKKLELHIDKYNDITKIGGNSIVDDIIDNIS